MSVNGTVNKGADSKYLVPVSSSGGVFPSYRRPTDWLILPSVVAADQTFVGLHAIYTDSNFLALSAAGNYTVDWGDSTGSENFSTGVVAQHIYDYNDVDFDGTLTSGGFKQAIVTVTPQSGQNLTTLNLHKRYTTSPALGIYTSGFIDIAIAGSLMTSLLIGVETAGSSTQVVNFRALEQVNILSSAITSASYLFNGCNRLGSVSATTATVTNFSFMFNNCLSLSSVPVMDTAAGTNFSNMFANNLTLLTPPLLNTAAGTDFSGMFATCRSLQSVPLFNTANGNNFSTMFSGCLPLTSVPLLNTIKGANFTSMFQDCIPLKTVPLFNTANGTNFTTMFSGCNTLQTIPLINTAKGTTFTGMFTNCRSLTTIPLLDTANGTNFANMFQMTTAGSTSLESIPLLNLANSTNNATIFNACASLANGKTTGNKVAISYASCKLSQTALESIFDGLGTSTAAGQIVTVSSNWGADTVATWNSNTVVGNTTVITAINTGVTVGMQVVGTGTPSTTSILVQFTDAGDTVDLNAHGLSDNDEVSFATITTTTGIVINKIYFVVGATTNTFQVAATLGGAAIALVSNGNGQLRYRATVTAVVANTSVTLSRPATSTGTNTSLSYRNLKTQTALLKGWAVTG